MAQTLALLMLAGVSAQKNLISFNIADRTNHCTSQKLSQTDFDPALPTIIETCLIQ